MSGYLDALDAMRRRGGSFASALAEAWLHADASNRARLERSFPDLLASYGHTLPSYSLSPALPSSTLADGPVEHIRNAQQIVRLLLSPMCGFPGSSVVVTLAELNAIDLRLSQAVAQLAGDVWSRRIQGDTL